MTNPISFEDQPLRSRAEHGPAPAGDLLLPRLPGYEIVRLLAEGGMGVVYEAWQEKPRRRVALKLLRPGLVTPALLRRFGREIELLGRLEHPAIARIYEAGADDSGGISQPFFAMEYVEGVEITRYVREQKLDLRKRLALFKRVVAGVHYAHQKGIIHRDLKPGNVFVDAAGAPKILDFGVARAIEAEDSTGTLTQDKGALFGTLQYMSPEQAAGQNAEVDIRSDVYSLGVMLFELLAGERPFRLNTTSIPEAIRIVHETEPPRLGTLDRALRGDLEIIVSTAMSKDKDRRYASAAALADDIQRYLDSEPIYAHPPSAWYRVVKFARRNKAIVGAALGIVAALALGLVSASIGLVRARRAEAEAVSQKYLAQANLQKAMDVIDQFTVFAATGPLASIPDARYVMETLLNDAMANYAQLVNNRLEDKQMLNLVRAFDSCGKAFTRLQNFAGAEQAFCESLHVKQMYCARHPNDRDHLLDLGDIWGQIARARGGAHRYDEAIAAAEEAVAVANPLYDMNPDDSRATSLLAHHWALVGELNESTGRYNEAIAAYDNTCRLRSALVRQQTESITLKLSFARALVRCGQIHQSAGHMDQIAAYYTQAYDQLRQVLQDEPGNKDARKDMAQVLKRCNGRLEWPEMSQLLKDSVPVWTQLARDDPQDMLVLNTLQWIHCRLGTSVTGNTNDATPRTPPATPSPATSIDPGITGSTNEGMATPDEAGNVIDAYDLETLRNHVGRIAVVRGNVCRISIEIRPSRRSFLQLGPIPSIINGMIPPSALPAFVEAYGEGCSALAFHDVEFRGLVYSYGGGPLYVLLTRPDQVRVLHDSRPDADISQHPPPPIISALDLAALNAHDGPVVAEGIISSVNTAQKHAYLRFDKPGRDRFHAVIPLDCIAPIEAALGKTLQSLPNSTARISGSVYLYRGSPCIEIRSPDQLTIVDSP